MWHVRFLLSPRLYVLTAGFVCFLYFSFLLACGAYHYSLSLCPTNGTLYIQNIVVCTHLQSYTVRFQDINACPGKDKGAQYKISAGTCLVHVVCGQNERNEEMPRGNYRGGKRERKCSIIQKVKENERCENGKAISFFLYLCSSLFI